MFPFRSIGYQGRPHYLVFPLGASNSFEGALSLELSKYVLNERALKGQALSSSHPANVGKSS